MLTAGLPVRRPAPAHGDAESRPHKRPRTSIAAYLGGGSSRPDAPTASAESTPARAQRPTRSQEDAYWARYRQSRRLDSEQIQLLRRSIGAVSPQDCPALLQLLTRPVADFHDDAAMCADLVRAVDNLLASAASMGLSRREVARLQETWTETAQAFYVLSREMKFHESEFASLASLCNRWSQREPVQGAGCIAVARILERLHGRTGPDILLNRLKDHGALMGRDLSLLMNAFAKLPQEDATRVGAEIISALVIRDRDNLLLPDEYQPQSVARLLNGFAKWPDSPHCQQAVLALVDVLWERRAELHESPAFSPMELSMCLNGLSHFSGPAVDRAVECVASAVVAGQAPGGEPQPCSAHALALMFNGLSKSVHLNGARQGLVACAEALVRRRAEVLDGRSLNAQDISNCLNGLAKLPEHPACAIAIQVLAEAIPSRLSARGDPETFLTMHLQNCLNALGKLPHEESCRRAGAAVAKAMWQRRGQLADKSRLDVHHLCTWLNGLSKWPADKDCGRLALGVLDELSRRCAAWSDMRSLNAQDVSNLLNAAAQWPDKGLCVDAVAAASREILHRRAALDDPAQFLSIHLFSMLNSLSKSREEAHCHKASIAVTQALLRRWPTTALPAESASLQLSIALNAAGKWTDECFRRLAVTAAQELVQRAQRLPDHQQFSSRHLSVSLNGLGKWVDEPACREAALLIAKVLPERRLALQDAEALSTLSLVNGLNGLSKWPQEEDCRRAARCLAEALLSRWDDELEDGPMPAKQLASLINSVSRWTDDEVFQRIALQTTGVIGVEGRPWNEFDLGELAQVANGMSRFGQGVADTSSGTAIEAELAELTSARLHEMASHLDSRPDRLAGADARNLSVLFKAFSGAGLKDCLRLIGRQGLDRLQALHDNTGFKADGLETMATLAAGFLPLTRAPELAKYRAQALRVLDLLQPVMDRKVRRYLEAQPATRGIDRPAEAWKPQPLLSTGDGEALGTRRPGLAFFLLLKTYAVVASQWKRSNLGDTPGPPASVRRQELAAWVEKTLERTRAAIEADLDESSWNLIAHIEAGHQLLNTIDLHLHKNLDRIVTTHPPMPLDVAAVRQELRRLPEVRDVMGTDLGAAHLEIIDLKGKPLSRPAALDTGVLSYSFLTRATGGRMPLREVQLPGHVSAFMLSRTIHCGSDLLRMDMFGGSHLQAVKARPHEILTGERARKADAPRYGRLPAVRLADTAPGAPFMRDLISKLNPQREDWFRMQRALLETVPRDHVVEGPIRLSLLADRPQGASPAFALRSPGGAPIQLVPNDGCGFIRQSLARKIPVIRQGLDALATPAGQRTPAQHKLLEGSHRLSPLPPQATQHYPCDEEVIEEARQHLRQVLQDRPQATADDSGAPQPLSKLTLHEVLVSASIAGAQGTAVPSGDDRLHLPAAKSAAFDAAGGAILLGKPPYDKPNLMPMAGERVATSRQGDATARFLDEAFAFQYSYTAWDESPSRTPADDDASMLHGKGVTIVVPDEMWPADDDSQWVWSREDMKVHSSWTEGRRRDQLPPHMDTVGSLRVKEVFPPGSLIAVPVSELRKRDADCDGDKVFVYAGLPKMAHALERFFDAQTLRTGVAESLKPPKTAHPSFADDGRYQAGRAAEILSALDGQELVGRFSNLSFLFTGQPAALRDAMAETALFGLYEGTERQLRKGLRAMLDDLQPAPPQAVAELLHRAQLGVRYARHPVALEVAELIRREIAALLQERDTTLAVTRTVGPSALSEALVERFPPLAQAYRTAADAKGRLSALATLYPKALLPHAETQRPPGQMALPSVPVDSVQSGYVPGAPMDTLRNLLALGVKVGTDAPKAVTQTALFAKVANRLDAVLRRESERTRVIPYTKAGVLQELRADRFHPQANLQRLRDNPTLAAGLMRMAIGELLTLNLIQAGPGAHVPPQETQAQLRQVAQTLRAHARQAEGRISHLVSSAISGHGRLHGQAERVKTEGALQDKLRLLMHKGLSARDAEEAIDDALRYSVVFEPERFAQGYAAVLSRLDKEGAHKTRVHNGFTSAGDPFKGINVKFSQSDEQGRPMRFEVQFHTGQTFDLKTRFHDDYKRETALRMQGASWEERFACLKEARDASKAVITPTGCEHIEDWDVDPLRLERRQSGNAAPTKTPAPPVSKSAMAVKIDRLLEGAAVAQREVTPLLEALSLHVVPEHSVMKTRRSIEKKIERLMVAEHLPLESAAARVRDAMRWVIQLPEESFGAEAARALDGLRHRGLRVTRVNNGFSAPDSTYAGVNVKLRTSSGVDCEIQFHTRDSLRVRNKAHRTYRQWQDAEVQRLSTRDPQERQALEQANAERLAALRAFAARVPVPSGVLAIQ